MVGTAYSPVRYSGPCQENVLRSAGLQNPMVVVMLSLSGGHRGGPALLAAGAVDNLFHEVGHALHSMLGRAHGVLRR
jgi:Zn-dependent oligopeptidase